jgi:hypothetical protein
MWAGFAMGLIGLFQQTAEAAPIPQQWDGLVMAAFGAVTMILRSVTSTSIGK